MSDPNRDEAERLLVEVVFRWKPQTRLSERQSVT